MEWLEFVLLALGALGLLAGALIAPQPGPGFPIPLLLVLAAIGFVIGSIAGETRRRTWEGAWLGLVLGPVGWLIVRLRPCRAVE